MAQRSFPNPTVAGACAVLLWGSALPIVKVVEGEIGLLGFMGFAYAAMAAFGVSVHLLRRRPLPDRAILRNRSLYARWIFFVLHEGLLAAGVSLVQRRHMPFLILINYLWPTAVILCSVMLRVVTIKRWWAFLLGTSVVILSMLPETLGAQGIPSDLFARSADCLAYLAVLIGAVSWGMYSALSRREGDVTGGASVLPLFQATLGLALPVSLLPGMTPWARLTPVLAVLLVAYCLLLSLAYAAWDLGMRRGNVVVLSLLADLIPWLSLIMTSILLQVTVGRQAILAAAVLVSGAMITRYGTLQGKVSPDVPEKPVISPEATSTCS